MVSFKSWLTNRSGRSHEAKSTYHLNVTVDRVDLRFNLVSFTAWRNALPTASPVPDTKSSAVSSAPPAAGGAAPPQLAILQVRNAELEQKLYRAEQAVERLRQSLEQELALTASKPESSAPESSAPEPSVSEPSAPELSGPATVQPAAIATPPESAALPESDPITPETLFAAMDDLVLIRDIQGRCTQILTPHAEHLLYKPAAEMLGQTLAETFPAEIADRFSGYLQQALQTQTTVRAEFCLPIQGQDTWMDARISPISATAVLWVVRDISDRKQLEAIHRRDTATLHQQAQQERLVSAITQRIRQSLDLNDILSTTVAEVQQLLQVDRVLLYQLHADGSGTVVVESVAPGWPSALHQSMIDPCFAAQSVQQFQQGRIVARADLGDPGLAPCYVEMLDPLQVRANLVVPIFEGDGLWGLLIAHHCAAPRMWQDWETSLLQQLAAQVGIAIQQANLYRQSEVELAERKRAEAALQELNQVLEQRVQQRTAEWERSQATLRQREQEFRTLVENAPDLILRLDRQFRFTYVNPKTTIAVGIPAAEIVGKTPLALGFDTVLVDTWNVVLERACATQQEQVQEYSISLSTGLRHRQSRVVPELAADGTVESLLVIIRDITDLKQTEAALRLSEERLRLALEAANMGVWNSNLDTEEQIWSAQSQSLFGFTPGEFDGTLDMFLQRIHPDDRDRVHQEVKSARHTGLYQVEYRVIWPHLPVEQAVRWIAAQGRVSRNESDGKLCINGIDLDITDRKRQEFERQRAEAALQQSEHMFRTVFDNAPIAMSLANVEDYGFVRVNAAHRQLLGYDDADIAHMNFTDCTYPDDVAANLHQTQQLRSGQLSSFQMEKRFIHKSGAILWTHMTVTLIRDAEGQPLYDIAMMEDITARKHAEDALRQSEEQFRRVFENAPIGIGLIDIQTGGFLRSNAVQQEMYGYSAAELATLTLADISHPDDLAADVEQIRQLVEGKISTYQMEKRLFRKNGDMLYGLLAATLIRDAAGTPLYCIGMVKDITQRKQAEEQLRASLQEKEVLLKEIHHRVKNNLQIISSLLRMQSRQVQDRQTGLLLQDSQNRVQSMALIHEQLYQSPDLSQIAFGDYVRQLVHNLFRSYGVDRQEIALHIETHDLRLSLNTAIPCGLIVNELVSNALKYAFPARLAPTRSPDPRSPAPKSKITIWLQTVAPGLQGGPAPITLMVRDNGIGMSAATDWQNGTSLGLRIVRNLVAQLHGDIRLNNTEGTCFYITFPNPPVAVNGSAASLP